MVECFSVNKKHMYVNIVDKYTNNPLKMHLEIIRRMYRKWRATRTDTRYAWNANDIDHKQITDYKPIFIYKHSIFNKCIVMDHRRFGTREKCVRLDDC